MGSSGVPTDWIYRQILFKICITNASIYDIINTSNIRKGASKLAITPRITVTLSEDDQKRLKKVLKKLDLKSPGQLLQFLVSGDKKRLEWIMEGFEHVDDLF